MIIRPAVSADAMGVARVHVRGWQRGYRGLLPDDYLDGLRPEERAGRYRFDSLNPDDPLTVVCMVEAVIAGFATTMPARDSDATGAGEVAALYVDPDRWRQGIGAALLAAACERLRSGGFREAILWVLVGNTAAERFYESGGWKPDGAHRTETIWGISAEDRRYRRIL